MTDIAVVDYSPSELAMIYVTERVRSDQHYRPVPVNMLATFRRIVAYTERWTGGPFDNLSEYFDVIDDFVGVTK